jgi:hypothetical protein
VEVTNFNQLNKLNVNPPSYVDLVCMDEWIITNRLTSPRIVWSVISYFSSKVTSVTLISGWKLRSDLISQSTFASSYWSLTFLITGVGLSSSSLTWYGESLTFEQNEFARECPLLLSPAFITNGSIYVQIIGEVFYTLKVKMKKLKKLTEKEKEHSIVLPFF